MKKLIASALFSAMALASMATLVPKGTSVRLALNDDLSSKTARVGDKVSLHVVDDVVVDGQVVVKKGTVTQGTVVSVARGRRFGVNARMEIRIDPVLAEDGTKVPISARQAGKATGGGTNKAAALSGAGVVALGPLGLGLGYFITGKNITLKEGDTLTTAVSENTDVKTSVSPARAANSGNGGGGS